MPSEGGGSGGSGSPAARFTTTVAQEEATNDVAKVLQSLVPDRCRLTLWSMQQAGQRRRDANVGLEFAELRLDASLQHTWLAEPEAGGGGAGGGVPGKVMLGE